MARNEQYIVGLDVGSSKVTAIVGGAMEDGSLEIVGTGQADAKGIRRGAIVNLEEAVDCIKRALDDAELMAGVDIDSVYLGLSGGHARPLNSRGVVTVSGAHREITRDDVRRAIDAAKAPIRNFDALSSLMFYPHLNIEWLGELVSYSSFLKTTQPAEFCEVEVLH